MKRDEQYTLLGSPADRQVSETTSWRHIVSVSMSRTLSTLLVVKARAEFYPAAPVVLVCEFTKIERMQKLPGNMAHAVKHIHEMEDLVVDQTIVGKSGGDFFKGLVRPSGSFTRVEIAAAASNEPSIVKVVARSDLINDLMSAAQDGTEVCLPPALPDAAALRAEIKSAPEAEELSDLFLAAALAVWRARKLRTRIEREGR
jgi:hypothetical protein